MNLDHLKSLNYVEINELCATQVMGWKYRKMYGYKENAYMKNEAEYDLIFTSNWNPTKNMNDAMMVLDKFERYEHIGNEYGHTVTIRTQDGTYCHRDKSFGVAACIAALLATQKSPPKQREKGNSSFI